MAADDKQRSITALRDLRPGMKNVTCLFIVIDKGSTNQTKDGSIVRKCRVADKSASICFSLWNEQAGAIEAGDILKLTKGYASVWKGGMMLYSGKYGILEKTGEFTMVYSETPDMSDPNQDFLQSQQPPHHHQPPTRGGGGGGAMGGGGGGNPQQHHHHHQGPQPPPSGYSNSISPQGGGPHNGRMGMNRNGNNHINHGMATGYTSVPPGHSEGAQGGILGVGPVGDRSQSDVNHLHRSGHPPIPPVKHSHPYSSYDPQEGAWPNLDPRISLTNHDHDRTPPHHQHPSSGRTNCRTQGGSRNFVDRHHPYSRPPPSDPPRHNGGWR